MARAADLDALRHLESEVRGFIAERLSGVPGWWERCVPQAVREGAQARREAAAGLNDALNKPEYGVADYLNFDDYHAIVARKDNWRGHFEAVFVRKEVFSYKMDVLRSLRNDVVHGRDLDGINSLRLRLHCYDICSQISEARDPGWAGRRDLAGRLGLDGSSPAM